MCIIIDNDVRSDFFGVNPSPVAAVIRKWMDGGGRMVTGGKNFRELSSSEAVRKQIADLFRDGKLRRISDQDADDETDRVRPRCQSNDAHVVGLARISGARILFSNDAELIGDFGNRNLISAPRGRSIKSMFEGQFRRLDKPRRQQIAKILNSSDCP